MIKCTKCNKEKIDSDFNFKIKNKGLRHNQCRECTRFSVKKHYSNNRQYYLSKAKKRNKEVKLEIVDYLQKYFLKNPCVDCGETDFAVLEFDHKGEFPKVKAVSTLIRHGVSFDKIRLEIAKCDVRCANCHRRKTARQFNWYKIKSALVA